MLRMKVNKSFYINICEFRGFISLKQVMSALEEISYEYLVRKNQNLEELIKDRLHKYNLTISHIPYKTFRKANKYCSKICDGESECTFKVEVLKTSISFYSCYVTNCCVSKKRRERCEIYLDSTLIDKLFNVKILN